MKYLVAILAGQSEVSRTNYLRVFDICSVGLVLHTVMLLEIILAVAALWMTQIYGPWWDGMA